MSHRIQTRESLTEVRYEIRGELARRALELEAQGRELIKLNIGNPGAFGFRAPAHLQQAIASNLPATDPYTHQQGLPMVREAIAAHYRGRGAPNAIPERIFVGNGVSELIDLTLRALLNPGDEVLVPSPDYPL
jgi:alanine-synthesizing transaminase